jgi:hypothetical protein
MTIKPFANNAAVVDAMRAGTSGNGVYFAPQGLFAAVSFTPNIADKTQALGPNLVKQVVT